MLTPKVTEINRSVEPVVRDTFIREFDGRMARGQANVVGLAAHRSRRRRSALAPARAA